MEPVKTEHRDGVALVTLDDRKRRNAMSLAMSEAVASTLAGLASEPGVGASRLA